MIDSNHSGDFTYGVSFSPNSKLLYVNTYYNIWQIDLTDKTNNSVQFIHGPDTTDNQFQGYEYPALAADGRIYIGNYNGVANSMSVIERPNELGDDCDFCPRCIKFDYPNVLSPPNMPYYALGALENSTCDTIGKLKDDAIKVYPNPFGNELKVYLPMEQDTEVTASLYNLLGQRVGEWNGVLNSKQELILNTTGLARSVYMLRVSSGKEHWNVKVVRE